MFSLSETPNGQILLSIVLSLYFLLILFALRLGRFPQLDFLDCLLNTFGSLISLSKGSLYSQSFSFLCSILFSSYKYTLELSEDIARFQRYIFSNLTLFLTEFVVFFLHAFPLVLLLTLLAPIPNVRELLADHLYLRINVTVDFYRSWCGFPLPLYGSVCFSSKPLPGSTQLLKQGFSTLSRDLAVGQGVTYFHKKRDFILEHQLLPLLRQFIQFLHRNNNNKRRQTTKARTDFSLVPIIDSLCSVHKRWGRMGWGSILQLV